MALDYSKLTDEELDAIANNNYSRLSDKTLQAIANDPAAKKQEPAAQPSAQTVLGGTESSASKVASRASLADSVINTATGTFDMAARALATPYYYATTPGDVGQAWNRASKAVGQPIAPDVVGRALGIVGTKQYEGAPVRQAGNYIGQGLQESVIAPLAQTTGLPEGAVGDIIGVGTMAAGPLVPKVAGAVGRGTVNTVRGAVDVGKGAVGGFSGDIARPGARPRPGQTASARQPIGETYIPQEELARWRAGEVETPNLQTRPTSELPQKALARTGGTVPYEGQGLRAFGEQLGQDYRNPYKLGAEVAGDYLLGGVPTVARLGMKAYQGIQGARAASELSRYGFTPLTAAEQAALKSGKPYPGGPVSGPVPPSSPPPGGPGFPMPAQLPQLGYNPNPGQTPMPMPGPGRRVNIEGESFNLPYQIDTSQVQTARPGAVTGPVSPKAMIQQAAAEKIAPPATPIQAAAQETVAQKAQRVMGDKYRAPVNEQPAPVPLAPVAPVEMPPAPVAAAPVTTAPVNTPAVKGTEMTRNVNEYTITEPIPGAKAKGKDKTVPTQEVTISETTNPGKLKLQPDINWTLATQRTPVGSKHNGPIEIIGTKDGVEYKMKINFTSAHHADLYAKINGKDTLVKQWYSDTSERDFVNFDKIQQKLGLDLQKISQKEVDHINARGFKPDPKNPGEHEFVDPVRYDKYNTTGVDPKGVWETDTRKVESYKKQQAEKAAKAAAKKAAQEKG